MITFERRVGCLLRYRRIFFPTRERALQISSSMMVSDVVRMFAVPAEWNEIPRVVKRWTTLTTAIDLSVGLERVLAQMKKKSCRYEIHRAEKMLKSIDIERSSPRALDDFLPVYNSFARAKGPVPTLSPRRFCQLTPRSDVFVLYRNGRPMCCHLLLRDHEVGKARLMYSGSRRFESPQDASDCGALNRYLHWYEMNYYHAEGILTYDFGGIRNLTHPTARFKLSFGGPAMSEQYYLLAGSPWLAKVGNWAYERFFKSALPALHTTP
jgi:Acetyltransferase (GNAT) domain